MAKVPHRPDLSDTIWVRFGDALLSQGFTAVPNLLLKYATSAGMTEGEIVFTLQVWSFWWGREHPYPSLSLIAERMGKTIRQTRRYVESLEAKGLLAVIPRRSRTSNLQISNEYDFAPLLERIRALAAIAGDLAVPATPDAVRLPVRRRSDSFDRAAARTDRGARTKLSAIEEDAAKEDTGKNGATRTSKYTRGRYAVCPDCGSRPCTPECPRQLQEGTP